MNKESILVVDQTGLRGRIDDPEFALERDTTVRIRFSGHQIVVPAKLLVAQKDGTYFLPVSLASLVEEGEQSSQQSDDQLVLPIIEEELQVKKRQVENGVRVTKIIHQKPEHIELPLISEEVEVQRIPMNRSADQPLTVRQEGDVLVIPVLEEVLVVQKQWMLKEEVHIITKRSEQRQEEVLIEPIQNATSEQTSAHPALTEEDERRNET